MPTTYTLDLAAPLVTALTERTGAATKQYLYGLGDSPMAVYTGTLSEVEGWTYLSGRDGLNSVRQETDAAGNVLTTRSFDPYGVPLQGGGGTPFGYTGEVWDAQTQLVFLRARYYNEATGRFIQRDPSRLERNLYAYAASNPVNRTDLSGLFSREAIVKSFGFGSASFEEFLSIYQLPNFADGFKLGVLSKRWVKWGWLAMLLSAQDGDAVRLGRPVIMTNHPYLEYSGGERIWLANCDQIMIGSRTLDDYTNWVLNAPNPRELPIAWRDTSASYYFLLKTDQVSVFVDGSDLTDYPDFHSVDISFPTPIGLGVSVLADRYGNLYIAGSAIYPSVGGGMDYSEGYVCQNESDCGGSELAFYSTYLDDETSIKGALTGPCYYAFNMSLDWGVAGWYCSVGEVLLMSTGLQLTVSSPLGMTLGIPLGINDPSAGWNWALQNRYYGSTLNQVRTMPETQ